MKIILFLITTYIYGFGLEINSDIIFCSTKDNLQKCVDDAAGKELRLLEGTHKSYMLRIPSNTTLVIPKGATVKLADDAVMPNKGGYVIGVHGSKENKIENVRIILDGIIDGNKKIHPYEKSGNEGINFKLVESSIITGNGIIKNCSGDGIDIDVSFNCMFFWINLFNNSGSGFHFGSPRPIEGSKDNIVMNIHAENNGFRLKRNGLDLSWPNSNGAIFINCTSKDNYRNWEINGKNGQIINSKSLNTGKVIEIDKFGGAIFTEINAKVITNQDFITKRTKLLLKNDLKKLFGKNNAMYDGLKYWSAR